MKKTMIHLLGVLIILGFCVDEAAAQRRRRGSVRHSRPDGRYSRTTSRSGDVTSTQRAQTQRTQGDRRSPDGTVTTRRGETVTGSRDVQREDDKITVDRQAQSTSGASREATREVEIDDGRVEQVKRESQATGRTGETIEREREVEREGYGVASFEGETKTSTGREAEVEGVAARGYYGRRGVVADVDTKHRGDWTTVAGRGPYGAAVARLPQGYRPYTYYGRSYYYYGSVYYRPYMWGGVPYYWAMPPPYGVWYSTVPVGAVMVLVAGVTYYYADHVCYTESHQGGSAGYEVVQAPTGVKTTDLPLEAATVTISGTTFYYYKNTFYRRVDQDYVVVEMPVGVTVVDALPAEFEILQAPNANAYFVYEGTHYLPYVRTTGEEVYLVVDPPPQARVTPASGTERVERTLSVPSGTALDVRFAGELSSGTATAGQRFTGYLASDLKVGEILAAPRGSMVYGTVVEAEKAGSMSGTAKLTINLTDIQLSGRVIPVMTQPYSAEGRSESKDTAKKVVGGAALGAVIGAIADGGEGAAIGAAVGAGVGTAKSATTQGQQVVIGEGTVIQFRLEAALTVPIFVTVATADASGP